MEEKARTILTKVKYATLATASAEGKPWNSPVFCTYDDAWNIYWQSSPESVHSKNIMQSGRVFIVVYDSTSDEGEGVYLQCTALVLSDEAEIRHALYLLGERRGEPYARTDKFQARGPQRIFRATPQAVWVNDADKDEDGDFVRDYRVEVQL